MAQETILAPNKSYHLYLPDLGYWKQLKVHIDYILPHTTYTNVGPLIVSRWYSHKRKAWQYHVNSLWHLRLYNEDLNLKVRDL